MTLSPSQPKTMSARRPLALMIALLAAACGAFAQGTEELRLTVGRSIVLDYPSDIRQISTSDPAVVDAIAVTTREILLHAKSSGFATVIVWARSGQRTIYSVIIEQNLEQVRRLLKETFPNESVQVQSTRDAITLTGRVSTKDMADRIVALVTPFGKTIVNNMVVAPAAVDKQILLRVRFAELDRNASRAFGVNLLSTGAFNTPGRITTGQFGAPDVQVHGRDATFTISDALNIFAVRPDLNFAALIKAMQGQGVLQVLAEPNLVTTNGKEASFLAGGEFPVPVLQGGGNAGAVTVQFREFGIRLTFNPVVTENNTIRMYVKPEVSTLDNANGVRLNGFFIPALSTRRVETNVELAEGQSFVIGGLIDQRLTDDMAKIPGLANIPLLGLLFKSRQENKNRTELIVLVTPEITKPINSGEPRPELQYPRPMMGPISPNMQENSGANPAAVQPEQEKSNSASANSDNAKKS